MSDECEIKNGDQVYYRRCFGEYPATFVGMADGMEHHDCVLIYRGVPCGAEFSGVEPVEINKSPLD